MAREGEAIRVPRKKVKKKEEKKREEEILKVEEVATSWRPG